MDLYSLLYERLGQDDIQEYRFDFTLPLSMEELESETDKKIFKIILIFVVEILYDEKKNNYISNVEIKIGENELIFNDLTEDDYNLLKSLDFEKIPLGIRARITDVLWVCRKDYKAAGIAACSYKELFIKLFDPTHWINCFNMIKRAITISAQIGKGKNLYNKCCQAAFDKIMLLDGNDPYWLSIKLIELLCYQKFGNENQLIDIADKIIINSAEIHNVKKVRSAYEIKLNFLKDSEAKKQVNMQFAVFLENEADRVQGNNVQGVFNAAGYLDEAVKIYNNNGYKEEANEAKKKLIVIQKKIHGSMVPISVNVEQEDFYEDIIKNFEGLSFKEYIIRLAQYTSFYRRDFLKNDVLKAHELYLSQRLFGENIVNGSGQIIESIPPLDWDEPEKDVDLLEMHMHRSALTFECILGETHLRLGIEKLNRDFRYTQNDLGFLINDNPIVPDGRESIFASAIYLGLQGQYYEALHILAPQMENLFRNIAKAAGGMTINFKDDGTSEEKALKTIFSMTELTDSYDEDILFLFKGLLNEQSGANIRNLIAHGLMEENEASGGIGIYFICAVIHLLALTSKECLLILKSSEKLRHFINTKMDKDNIVINENSKDT